MLANLERGDGFLLADEMGLGKTILTAAALRVFHSRHPNVKMLVLAPLSTLPHWKQEFAAVGFDGVVCVVHSSNKDDQPLLSDVDVAITTYEGFVRAPLAHDCFDLIVVDEASKIKNKATQFTKLMIGLAKTIRYRVALTATPLENSLLELYYLMQFVQPGWCGGSVTSFKTMYSLYLTRGVKVKASPQQRRCALAAAREIHNKLKPFMVRRLKSESENKQQDVLVNCPMSGEQSAVYKRLLATHKRCFKKTRKVRGADGVEHSESFHSKKGQMLALKQQAELMSVINGRHPLMSCIPTGKMQFLRTFLTDATKDSKIALFFKQKILLHEAHHFLVRCGLKCAVITGSVTGDKRQEAIDSMNNGDAQVLLGTSRSCGSGINLLSINAIFLMESDWNAQVDQQTAARGSRPGNPNPVTVYRLVTPDSIETAIDNTASDKLVLARLVLGDRLRSSTAKACEAVDKAVLLTKRKHLVTSFNERAHKRQFHF